MQEISFEELKKIYSSINPKCKRAGAVYIPGHLEYEQITGIEQKTIDYDNGFKKQYWGRNQPITIQNYYPDTIINLTCHQISCARCRPKILRKMHNEILTNIYRQDLQKQPIKYHWVSTFPGNEIRKKYDYSKSYKIMSNEYNKLLTRIRYEFNRYQKGLYVRNEIKLLYNNEFEINYNPKKNCPDLDIITIVRSQNHPYEEWNKPGYCHHHNLINYEINQGWLEDCIKKHNYIIGFQKIKENKNVAEYLATDFFNEEENIIPFGIRHYNYSRNIKFHNFDGILKNGCKVFTKNFTLDHKINKILEQDKKEIILFGEKVYYKEPIGNFFVEIISEFYENMNKEKTNDYGSLKTHSEYNKKTTL